MQVFPHVLIRVAGLPFENLKDLDLKGSIAILHQLLDCRKEILSIKEAVCDELYRSISLTSDMAIRMPLIKLKRDVFNRRGISREQFRFASDHVSAQGQHFLRRQWDLEELERKSMAALLQTYSVEIDQLRANLYATCQNSDFQQGLLLSSQSLFESIRSTFPQRPTSAKRTHDRDEGLIKYLSRVTGKTSPFSSFTSVSFADIHDHDGPSSSLRSKEIIRFADPRMLRRSHVRLNNHLFRFLQDILARRIDTLEWLCIRLNPSLRLENDQYHFLTNSDNIESFQSVATDDVLSLIEKLLRDSDQRVRYGQLFQFLAEQISLERSFQLHSYLKDLIGFGFLEIDWGISGIDPNWDIALSEKLSEMPETIHLASSIVEILRTARVQIEEYQLSPISERPRLLNQLHERFGALSQELEFSDEELSDGNQREEGSPTFKRATSKEFAFSVEDILYEDTAVYSKATVDRDSINKIVDLLNRLVRATGILAPNYAERKKLGSFFDRKYGERKVVPLLTFYEDYYRDIKKSDPNTLQGDELGSLIGSERPLNVEKPIAKRWLESVSESVLSRITDDCTEIHIVERDIAKANAEFGLDTSNEVGSWAVMAHLFSEPSSADRSDVWCVVNNLIPGFGKMTSRFLHMFEGSITDRFRKHNEMIAGEGIFAEINDASYLNVNIHPPLMPVEITIPCGNNSFPAENQISVSDICVKRITDKQDLELIEKRSNRRVYPFDLGFQGYGGRSELFQLLSKFSLAEIPLIFLLVDEIRESYLARTQHAYLLPRVIFEEVIVLQRRAWIFPKDRVPSRHSSDDDCSFLVRVNEWRINEGIPENVFMFVLQLGKKNELAAEDFQRFKTDDYKPQFISFSNPFLIRLFGKLIARASKTIKIEEMLPEHDSLDSYDGHKYAIECVVHWYEATEGEPNQQEEIIPKRARSATGGLSRSRT